MNQENGARSDSPGLDLSVFKPRGKRRCVIENEGKRATKKRGWWSDEDEADDEEEEMEMGGLQDAATTKKVPVKDEQSEGRETDWLDFYEMMVFLKGSVPHFK